MVAPCATTIELASEPAPSGVLAVWAVTAPAARAMWPSISTWLARKVSAPPTGPAMVTFSGTVMRPFAFTSTSPKPVVT